MQKKPTPARRNVVRKIYKKQEKEKNFIIINNTSKLIFALRTLFLFLVKMDVLSAYYKTGFLFLEEQNFLINVPVFCNKI